MSKIASIKHYDIANGEKIRTSIFFSGCEHYCKNCFNSELWDFKVGEEFNREFYETKIKPTINEHIDGISILGGEPMHPNNIKATSQLVEWFKNDFPNKTIWMWSGYTFEELMPFFDNYMYIKDARFNTTKHVFKLLLSILNNIDVLVDGPFIEEQKDLTLKWCGSKNQRVIDMHKTMQQGKIVLYG